MYEEILQLLELKRNTTSVLLLAWNKTLSLVYLALQSKIYMLAVFLLIVVYHSKIQNSSFIHYSAFIFTVQIDFSIY